MSDIHNPTGQSEIGFGPLAHRLQTTPGDATAARLFAAVEQGIDELVRAANRERSTQRT